MLKIACSSREKSHAIIEASIVAAGMCLFATFIHCAVPLKLLAIGGLCLTAGGILHGLSSTTENARLLGLRFSRQVTPYLICACLLGIGLGFTYRLGYGMESVAPTLQRFALLASAIGATEEVLYRGYLQGRLSRFRPWLAIGLAAACHTAYKTSLFVIIPAEIQVNLFLLSICTLVVGCLFGYLRQLTGSLWPPLLAHCSFDIIAYGDRVAAPWWVWY
jgi:membrane protease YdiL (CAAX protease family)